MDVYLLILVIVLLCIVIALGFYNFKAVLNKVSQDNQKQQAVIAKALPTALGAAVGDQIAPLVKSTEQMGRLTADSFEGLTGVIIQSHQQLQEASRDLRNSISAIPPMVTSISEATDHLAQTHEQLQRALASLAAPGAVQDWVGTFSQAIQPLQQASAAIDQHYKLNGEVLRITEDLLRKWDAQGTAVRDSSVRIGELLELWTSGQEVSRSQGESERRQQLLQVNQQLETLSRASATVQQQIGKLAESNNELHSALDKTATMVEQSAELYHKAQQQLQMLSERLGDLTSQQLQQAQSFGAISEQAEKAAEQLSKILETTYKTIHTLYDSNKQAISSFAAEYEHALEHARRQAEEQILEQQEIIDRLARSVESLPTRNGQRMQIAVEILIFVVLIGMLVSNGN